MQYSVSPKYDARQYSLSFACFRCTENSLRKTENEHVSNALLYKNPSLKICKKESYFVQAYVHILLYLSELFRLPYTREK
jgi:hypothetical protein